MSAISSDAPQKVAKPHNLELKERKRLTVTGVTSVPTFTAHAVVATLDKTTLNVAGTDLKVEALDLDAGTLTLTGEVNSLKYSVAVSPAGLVKKIFK